MIAKAPDTKVDLPLEALPRYARMLTTSQDQLDSVKLAPDYVNQLGVQAAVVKVQAKRDALQTTMTNLVVSRTLVSTLLAQRPLDAIALHHVHDELETALNTASGGNAKAALAWLGKVQKRAPLPLSTDAPVNASLKNTATSCTAVGKCKADPSAICYLFQTGTDPAHPELWPAAVIEGGAKHLMPGLTVGQKVYMRIAIQRRKTGQGAWSDVMELVVR